MEYILQNALPILLATAAGLLIGLGFRRATASAGRLRLGPEAPLSLGDLVVIALAQAWLAAILAGALILAPSEAGAWTMAVGSAVVIWVGFVVPATVVNHVHRGLPKLAPVVDAAYWLIVMLVQAVVLKSIGLTAPTG
ncbi:hypothetical protein BZG35_06460 [Brevundimonas sp. LM2]|uniref:DUF1761 domain-containing protein n=1 Tax=Brevundimonas sp. LM2 TaxID=1938605 RepID=UPI000983DDB8|nr:DUF1761 domain-containing protein [Brevundimonas sp. LM2]AQR61332.1 hypothetical protein BZG35_06460 [Brevundimonas sp. LM2]